jgi:hypothetical protein
MNLKNAIEQEIACDFVAHIRLINTAIVNRIYYLSLDKLTRIYLCVHGLSTVCLNEWQRLSIYFLACSLVSDITTS